MPNLRTDYDGAWRPEIEHLNSILKKAILLFVRM